MRPCTGGCTISALNAAALGLPKLPELSSEDLKSVRSFLPGKLLGRTAAILSLAVLVLVFAGAADRALKFLGADLTPLPWAAHYGLLIGLPVLAVAAQLAMEWRSSRVRRQLQALAVRVDAVPSGYFRIGPYLNTEEDRAKFTRADLAHEKVLTWLERSVSTPLYLTGDSGSGKSSLLSASVLPALRNRGWTVVEARAWQDPVQALRDALTALAGSRRSAQDANRNLRQLINSAARRAAGGLVLVLDQFEEFLILGESERRQAFAALVANLASPATADLRLLLVLRSDYQPLLEDCGLPPLRHGENFFQVARFTLPVADEFMTKSGLGLETEARRRLLDSAAELDETPGLVRPITLNVVGHVLASGQSTAPSLDAGLLVRRYIEQTIDQPALRDTAPQVLEKLVTDQATKRPRTEKEIASETGLRLGEVRGVLIGLGNAALARPLDAAQGFWELSHDFIARAVARYLGRQRRALWRRATAYAAPALFAAAVVAVGGVIGWDHLSPLAAKSELEELGITLTTRGNAIAAEKNSSFDPARLPEIGRFLTWFRPQSLDLSFTHVADLEPLKGLTALQSLNLAATEVVDLEPLKGLTKLQTLDLSGDAGVSDLEPLKGLTALQSLNLTLTQVADLEPLKGLTKLQSLDLAGTSVANLEPLKGLTELRDLTLPNGHQLVAPFDPKAFAKPSTR